ncbi:hypothetical protein [Pseudaminobacter soli (ex Li et al. 2025)]|uniref:Exopolysaccharide production protein YjbE n=1 Tax=Pseudaminobacter soli (ex Li et al. 2025) TaxID=1295366 RepID=A0A2P7S1E8_9HYPH|nr:hypothetical protein [Mesorhizobium soli]PSJ56271.1 hypothetical protein C7I85_25220 [Mesorhizobium soli]
MKSTIAILAACSLTALTTWPTLAACPDKTTTSSTDSSGKPRTGISKDGTHAPLEKNKNDQQANKQPQEGGDTMPLATEQGGGNKDLATSQQDVEAQQKHGKTAAAQADQNKCKD